MNIDNKMSKQEEDKFYKYIEAHRQLLIKFGYMESVTSYMWGDDTITGDFEVTVTNFHACR